MKLWHKVIIGLVLGILCGHYFPDLALKFKFIGEIFNKAIKLVIGPLVFVALINGLLNAGDGPSLGRVGLKATIAFLVTTCFAVGFGIAVAAIFKPGIGANLPIALNESVLSSSVAKKFDIMAFIVDIVPHSLTQAMLDGNVIQIVFVAIFTGITINKLGSDIKPAIKHFFELFSKVMLKMIAIVIELSPYAAFALISVVIATDGLGILFNLSKLVAAIVTAMLLQYMIFGVMIKFIAKISPMPFYKKSLEYQAIAFSTSSSKAALGTTMQVCREKLGISESSTSFILPLGASINMDGMAINLGLTAIFFAQAFGISLAPHEYLIIILTSTIGTIGGAGIPGASLIMLPMVLASVNIPTEGVIGILAGIDRIIDMLRTTINITGDSTITLIIDATEDKLDKEKYFS
jgi:Na+/H+-dicarboxylate symporter